MLNEPTPQPRRKHLARGLLFAGVLGLAAFGSAQTLSWPSSSEGSVNYSASQLTDLDFANVETGGSHVVAVTDGGAIYTWGASNAQGQLGRSGTASIPTLVSVFQTEKGQAIPAPVITRVAASATAGFAVDSQQQLYYWGTIPGSPTQTRPTRVALGATLVLDVAAGGDHGLIYGRSGLKGTLLSFGSDDYGQLGVRGNHKDTSLSKAADITKEVCDTNNGTVLGLAAGTDHSVVLLGDGTVRTFGRNSSGQLGNGTTTQSSNKSPVVTARSFDGFGMDAVQVEAGNDYTLVRSAGGSVFAAGNNAFGLLNRPQDPRFFVPVENLPEVFDISAGYNHALASTVDGLFEWVFTVTGDADGSVVTPQPVPGIVSASVLEAGNSPTPTSGPWDAFYQGSPVSGNVLSHATLGELGGAPVFTSAVVYSDGVPVDGTVPSESDGFVRIYTDKAAENGNGPTFTLLTESFYAGFGSGTVQDGLDYVDVPFSVSAVTVDTFVDFEVFGTDGSFLYLGGFFVAPAAEASWVSALSVDNATHPGQPLKGGNSAEVTVELVDPAPAGGVDVFVGTSNSVVPGGYVHVDEGATSGSVLKTVGRVDNYDEVEFSVFNPDFSEVDATAEVYTAEVLSVTSTDSYGGGGSENPGNHLTVTLDSPPPVFGLPVGFDSSNPSVVSFVDAPFTLTSEVSTIDLTTTVVASPTVVTLTVTVNGLPTAVVKTVTP